MRGTGNPQSYDHRGVNQGGGRVAGSAAASVVGKDTQLEKICGRMHRRGVLLPSVTIEFRNLTVEVGAHVRNEVSPTIPQSTRSFFRVSNEALIGQERRKTRVQTVLNEASGTMQPGRMTLLLAPPGSGKSVVMKTFAGRGCGSSQMSGEITYNGVPLSGCIPHRTCCHLSEYKHHLENLTVRETLEFAHRCQNPGHSTNFFKSTLRELYQMCQGRESFKRMASIKEDGEHHHPAASTPSALASMEDEGESSMRGPLGNGSNCQAILDGLVDVDSLNDCEFSQFLEDIWGTQVKMDIVIKHLGLSDCLNRYLKESDVAGLTLGELKRVSIAEALMGPRSVLFLDNFSCDLDGNALHQELQLLANATHALRLTTTVALEQPNPETLSLFDDVLLLTDGNIVYHGPVNAAIPFFESLGFVNPIGKDPAAFLMAITTPQGQAEFATDDLKERIAKRELEGDITPMPVPLPDMSAAFRNRADCCEPEAASLGSPFNRSHHRHLALFHEHYALSHNEALLTLFRRQCMVSIRGRCMIFSLLAFLIAGFFVGMVFWGSKSNSMNKGANFFGGSFALVYAMSVATVAQVPSFRRQIKVFHKQFGDGYFSAIVFSWSVALGRIPLALAEVGMFVTPAYLLIGLSTDSAKEFFVCLVLLFLVYLSTTAIVTCISSTHTMGINAYICINLFMLVSIHLSGFPLTRTEIPRAWVWVYWIMPFAWAERALLINEWKSPSWDGADSKGFRKGDVFLQMYGVPSETIWIWRATAYLIFILGLFTTLMGFALARSHKRNKNKVTWAGDSAAIAAGKTLVQMNALAVGRDRSKVVCVHPEPSGDCAMPFPPILLVFKDISFAEKRSSAAGFQGLYAENRCLYSVSAFAAPTSATAIISEPTDVRRTLLNILAGREPDNIASGEILANDVHCMTATVREALALTGRLRLDKSVPNSKVNAMIRASLDLVGMSDMHSRFIGPGLSAQQRKRLSIAEELLANPSVLFVDEPTTGLEYGEAALVMQSIANVSRSGRTVLMTIQHPSIDSFQHCDRVLLIKFGQVIYFGEVGAGSKCFVGYVRDLAPKCGFHPGDDPIAWVLKLANGFDGTLSEAYKGSALCAANNVDAERLGKEIAARSDALAAVPGETISIAFQLILLSKRILQAYWRCPSYFANRLWMTAIASFVLGTLYWGKGSIQGSNPADRATVATVHNLMGFWIGTLTFLGLANAITVTPVAIAEKPLLSKERSRKAFSAVAYVAAFGVAEVIYTFLQAVCFVPIVFFSARLEVTATQFLYFFAMTYFSLVIFTFVGVIGVFLVPYRGLSHGFRECVVFIWVLLSGFVIPISEVPWAWRWLHEINPIAWMLNGIAISLLEKNKSRLDALGTETTVTEYLSKIFGHEHQSAWLCLLIVFGFTLFCQLLMMLTLKFARVNR